MLYDCLPMDNDEGNASTDLIQGVGCTLFLVMYQMMQKIWLQEFNLWIMGMGFGFVVKTRSFFFFYGWSVKNQHVFNNQRFIFMLLVMDFSG